MYEGNFLVLLMQVGAMVMFIWGIWNLLNSLTEEPISITKRLTGQRHCSHRCEACHHERHSPYSN